MVTIEQIVPPEPHDFTQSTYVKSVRPTIGISTDGAQGCMCTTYFVTTALKPRTLAVAVEVQAAPWATMTIWTILVITGVVECRKAPTIHVPSLDAVTTQRTRYSLPHVQSNARCRLVFGVS
jgi:hypothetical protein